VTTRRSPREPDEGGLTLAELLVHCAILAILFPLVGVLLHGALTSQRDVETVTQAGDSVQIAARSVERGIRNASSVSPVTAPSAGSELLVARINVGDAAGTTWVCQGWYYAGGVLYTRRMDVAGAPTPAISTADLSQWSVLVSGVGPRVNGQSIFTRSTSAATTTVGVDLAVTSGAKQVAVMSTAFTTRPQGQTGGAPCF
jgi:type II secretory pathway component PulJ